jgi:hypothetical protein
MLSDLPSEMDLVSTIGRSGDEARLLILDHAESSAAALVCSETERVSAYECG